MLNRKEWWKKTIIYQIYPKSFMDKNRDGIGDLEGILEKLDYLEVLGVKTIWLNPIFLSPFKDAGYDVIDYKKIDPRIGNMEKCEELIKQIHERKMKIIFDMVLNHTSDRHPWFMESRSNKTNPKRNWYVWRDGKKSGGKRPPNNWKSLIHWKSGWHYDEKTNQWYWSHFFDFQPDLNYWNPKVKEVMFNNLRYWLDKGVDGFRLDFINGLFHDKYFRDNPFKLKVIPNTFGSEKLFQGSKYTLNRPETLMLMKDLRNLVQEYTPSRFLVGEAVTSPKILRKFCGEQKPDGIHATLNFASLEMPLKIKSVKNTIKEHEKIFPDPYIPTWVFSSHDRMRRITRLKNDFDKAKLNIMLQLTLRGIPIIYYGEEIGMPQSFLDLKNSNDPLADAFKLIPPIIIKFFWRYFNESPNRDECRTPMLWDDSPNAGFCDPRVKPWLPISPIYHSINVKNEMEKKKSIWWLYKELINIRNTNPALHSGNFRFINFKNIPRSILAYERYYEDEVCTSKFIIFLNFSKKNIQFKIPQFKFKLIISTFIESDAIKDSKIILSPNEGIICSRISNIRA